MSYIGDVRMGFAEDSRKIERIAQGSAEGLALMYNKRLDVSSAPYRFHILPLPVDVAQSCAIAMLCCCKCCDVNGQ